MSFAEEFKRRVRKIDGGQVSKKPARKIELYSLIKIQNGIRTRVGFGLSQTEAETLSTVLMKKIKKLNETDDSGGPLFEITLSEITKEI